MKMLYKAIYIYMYICNNQINMTYNVYLNNNKNRNYQDKWIWVKIDYIFLIQVKKGRWASEAQVGPLCEDKILAVWGLKGSERTGDSGNEKYCVNKVALKWANRPIWWMDCFDLILGMWPDLIAWITRNWRFWYVVLWYAGGRKLALKCGRLPPNAKE